ncbi:hypothetical protein [Verrucomicrobium spinosum]|uniref:hypothetical protein n=1 Tax=Verrucomicrobium spinosum TaxID=2736 RepID=UPI0012F6D973|nr:hypothetical protein [Verrucomicrobium spinosum]
MKSSTLVIFLTSLLAGSLLVCSQRNARNGYFEYCTTKAYGFPYPWLIENCPCDGRGGLTEHPTQAKLWNAMAALALAGVFSGVSLLVVRQVIRARNGSKIY